MLIAEIGNNHLGDMNKAKELNITGFVRNTRGGNVEAIFIGDEKNIDTMVEYCKKGPGGSIVENINVEDNENNETFDSFEVRM